MGLRQKFGCSRIACIKDNLQVALRRAFDDMVVG